MDNYEPTPLEALERIIHTDYATFGGSHERFLEWLHSFCADVVQRNAATTARADSGETGGV
jgi:hypothetical protein